jgi:formate dehydrogenase subunit delta
MDITRLTYMANQIARNFAAQGEDAAITATAQHIRDFWDPRMKSAILAQGVQGLDPIASAAIKRIAG